MIIANLFEFSQFLKTAKPIISIDYGQRKIGVAISNLEHTIAMPLRILRALTDLKQLKLILAIIQEYSAVAIVVGLPINMNGLASGQTQIVQKFAEHLQHLSALPIYLQDERLTSKAANNLLRSLGATRKDRDRQDDSFAASMILETTLYSLIKLKRQIVKLEQ